MVSNTCERCPHCGADIQQQVFNSLSPKEKEAMLAPKRRAFIIYCILGEAALIIPGIVALTGDYPQVDLAILCFVFAFVLLLVFIGRATGKLG